MKSAMMLAGVVLLLSSVVRADGVTAETFEFPANCREERKAKISRYAPGLDLGALRAQLQKVRVLKELGGIGSAPETTNGETPGADLQEVFERIGSLFFEGFAEDSRGIRLKLSQEARANGGAFVDPGSSTVYIDPGLVDYFTNIDGGQATIEFILAHELSHIVMIALGPKRSDETVRPISERSYRLGLGSDGGSLIDGDERDPARPPLSGRGDWNPILASESLHARVDALAVVALHDAGRSVDGAVGFLLGAYQTERADILAQDRLLLRLLSLRRLLDRLVGRQL